MTFFQKSIVGLTWFHGIPTYDLPMAGLCSPPPWMNSYRRAGKLETVFCALSRFGQVKTPFDSAVARSRSYFLIICVFFCWRYESPDRAPTTRLRGQLQTVWDDRTPSSPGLSTGAKLHGNGHLLNQIRGARAHNVAAQDPIRFRVGDDLHQPDGVIGRHGPTAGTEGEGAHVVRFAIGFDLLFRASYRGDFRMGVNNVGNDVVVHRGFLAGDALSHHHALVRAFVGEHRTTHHVTDRPNAGGIGGTQVVDVDKASLVQIDAGIFGQQAFGIGATADGDDQLVKGFLLLVPVFVGVGHDDLFALGFGTGNPTAEPDIQALLAEYFVGFFGDLLIHDRQKIVHGFQHDHLGAESAPNAAQFQADHTATDDTQTLRYGIELQGTCGVDDQLVVHFGHGNINRAGPGSQNDVFGGVGLLFAFFVGDFYLAIGQQFTGTKD